MLASSRSADVAVGNTLTDVFSPCRRVMPPSPAMADDGSHAVRGTRRDPPVRRGADETQFSIGRTGRGAGLTLRRRATAGQRAAASSGSLIGRQLTAPGDRCCYSTAAVALDVALVQARTASFTRSSGTSHGAER